MTIIYKLTGEAFPKAARKRPHQPETMANNLFVLVLKFNHGFFTRGMAVCALDRECVMPENAFNDMVTMGYIDSVGETYHTI